MAGSLLKFFFFFFLGEKIFDLNYSDFYFGDELRKFLSLFNRIFNIYLEVFGFLCIFIDFNIFLIICRFVDWELIIYIIYDFVLF